MLGRALLFSRISALHGNSSFAMLWVMCVRSMFAAAVLQPSSFSLKAFSMLQHAMASLRHPEKAHQLVSLMQAWQNL